MVSGLFVRLEAVEGRVLGLFPSIWLTDYEHKLTDFLLFLRIEA